MDRGTFHWIKNIPALVGTATLSEYRYYQHWLELARGEVVE